MDKLFSVKRSQTFKMSNHSNESVRYFESFSTTRLNSEDESAAQATRDAPIVGEGSRRTSILGVFDSMLGSLETEERRLSKVIQHGTTNSPRNLESSILPQDNSTKAPEFKKYPNLTVDNQVSIGSPQRALYKAANLDNTSSSKQSQVAGPSATLQEANDNIMSSYDDLFSNECKTSGQIQTEPPQVQRFHPPMKPNQESKSARQSEAHILKQESKPNAQEVASKSGSNDSATERSLPESGKTDSGMTRHQRSVSDRAVPYTTKAILDPNPTSKLSANTSNNLQIVESINRFQDKFEELKALKIDNAQQRPTTVSFNISKAETLIAQLKELESRLELLRNEMCAYIPSLDISSNTKPVSEANARFKRAQTAPDDSKKGLKSILKIKASEKAQSVTFNSDNSYSGTFARTLDFHIDPRLFKDFESAEKLQHRTPRPSSKCESESSKSWIKPKKILNIGTNGESNVPYPSSSAGYRLNSSSYVPIPQPAPQQIMGYGNIEQYPQANMSFYPFSEYQNHFPFMGTPNPYPMYYPFHSFYDTNQGRSKDLSAAHKGELYQNEVKSRDKRQVGSVQTPPEVPKILKPVKRYSAQKSVPTKSMPNLTYQSRPPIATANSQRHARDFLSKNPKGVIRSVYSTSSKDAGHQMERLEPDSNRPFI
jgi:hypothetical protein